VDIKKALENFAEFEAASKDWGARSRKMSRLLSTRSMQTSSYFAALAREEMEQREAEQRKNMPPPPTPPAAPPDSPEDRPDAE